MKGSNMNTRIIRPMMLALTVTLVLTLSSSAQINRNRNQSRRQSAYTSLPTIVMPPWFAGTITPSLYRGQYGVDIRPMDYPGPLDNLDMQPQADMSTTQERTSDAINAEFDKDGKLIVKWTGDPRSVNAVTVSQLDKDRKILSSSVITKTPVTATLTITNKSAYYQVLVEYANGATTKVVSPL